MRRSLPGSPRSRESAPANRWKQQEKPAAAACRPFCLLFVSFRLPSLSRLRLLAAAYKAIMRESGIRLVRLMSRRCQLETSLPVNQAGRGRIVIFPVLVLVRDQQLSLIAQPNGRERRVLRRDRRHARQPRGVLRLSALVPDRERISSGRDVPDRVLAGRIGFAVVRRVHHHHHTPPLPMHLAENAANSDAIESHAVRRTRFIQPEIEALAVEHRKYVVEERVEVRKADRRAGRNRQHMRLGAVLLVGDFEISRAARSVWAPPAAFSHPTALEESDSFCDFPADDNVTIPCTVTCAAALPIATNSARGRMDVRDTIKTESPRRD